MENITRRGVIVGLGVGALLAAGNGIAAAAVKPSPQISLTPATGPAGTKVTVQGAGFPKTTPGTVTAGAATAAFKTAANGSFTTTIVIPTGSGGSTPVTATAGTASAAKAFTVTSAVPPVSAALLRFGVANPGGPLASTELDGISTLAGESPSIILFYKDFQQSPPISELDAAHNRGALPLLSWEPWVAGGGVNQPAYTLARIAGGVYDAYLSQWGSALANWGKPLMLRFAHEMNGDWYPWCEGVNGNQPGDYVRAWRHVHDVVTAAGATNVTWVWAPNGGGPVALPGLYPGDGYVDVVGLDSYNWGTTQSWSSWQNPDTVFGPWLDQLRSIAPAKQLVVTETASTEIGGSKPDWITALIPYLEGQAAVTGFVWFDYNKETDWRIDSSTASAAALKTALTGRR